MKDCWTTRRLSESNFLRKTGARPGNYDVMWDTSAKVLRVKGFGEEWSFPAKSGAEVMSLLADRVWPRKWNSYSELPGYKVKIHVDTSSGLVIGFLVVLNTEQDPDSNHVHYWYNNESREAEYQMKSGRKHFSSSFADYIIEDIRKKLPSLLRK